MSRIVGAGRTNSSATRTGSSQPPAVSCRIDDQIPCVPGRGKACDQQLFIDDRRIGRGQFVLELVIASDAHSMPGLASSVAASASSAVMVGCRGTAIVIARNPRAMELISPLTRVNAALTSPTVAAGATRTSSRVMMIPASMTLCGAATGGRSKIASFAGEFGSPATGLRRQSGSRCVRSDLPGSRDNRGWDRPRVLGAQQRSPDTRWPTGSPQGFPRQHAHIERANPLPMIVIRSPARPERERSCRSVRPGIGLPVPPRSGPPGILTGDHRCDPP